MIIMRWFIAFRYECFRFTLFALRRRADPEQRSNGEMAQSEAGCWERKKALVRGSRQYFVVVAEKKGRLAMGRPWNDNHFSILNLKHFSWTKKEAYRRVTPNLSFYMALVLCEPTLKADINETHQPVRWKKTLHLAEIPPSRLRQAENGNFRRAPVRAGHLILAAFGNQSSVFG